MPGRTGDAWAVPATPEPLQGGIAPSSPAKEPPPAWCALPGDAAVLSSRLKKADSLAEQEQESLERKLRAAGRKVHALAMEFTVLLSDAETMKSKSDRQVAATFADLLYDEIERMAEAGEDGRIVRLYNWAADLCDNGIELWVEVGGPGRG